MQPDLLMERSLISRYVESNSREFQSNTMKHNTHHGDEKTMENLYNMGRLGEKVPGGPDFTEPDPKTARVGTVAKDTSKI
jgi:hypothetical protein